MTPHVGDCVYRPELEPQRDRENNLMDTAATATATLVWSLISAAIAVSCPTVPVTVADSSSSSPSTTTIMRYIIRHAKETGSQHPCIKASPTQREP